MQKIDYIPENDEAAIIRRCLLRFGRSLQQRGEIRRDVSEEELASEMGQHVTPILDALHGSPLYPHLRESGPEHLEDHVWKILLENLG